MTLEDLIIRLGRFADAELSLDELRLSFLPALEADPLDVSQSDSTPWDTTPDDARCYWRLLHLFDTVETADDEPALRRLAGRLAHAVRQAGSTITLELLPVLADQDRFCTIVRKHAQGIISRTGFLSVVAESGYPAHVKLWLQHAGPEPLGRLCEGLESGDVRAVAGMVERAP